MYVVDTIRFENPVIFWINEYHFIMEKDAFLSFNGTEEEIFERDDTFLLSYFFSFSLPSKYFHDYLIATNPEGENISTTNKHIERAFHIKETNIEYLLLLVNGYFFNHRFTGFMQSPVSDRRAKFNYYRVVVPIEKNEER